MDFCFCFFLFICIQCQFLVNAFDEPSIIFPATISQQTSQRSFDWLSSVSNSNDSILEISRAAEAFSLEYFQCVTRFESGNDTNMITSPFSIWSMLLILNEGATGITHEQLTKVLHLPKDLSKIRQVYKYLQRAFTKENSAIELISKQILFSDINRPINIEFQHDVEHTYEADYFPVNFQDRNGTVQKINNYVRQTVKGKIIDVIDASVLSEAQIVLISVLYFQGQWKEPFQMDATMDLPFYNEIGMKIGTVPTMVRKGGCTYVRAQIMEAELIELAYGLDRKYSMIILLPRKDSSLIRVIDNLRVLGLDHIIDHLNQSEEDPDLEIYLPRFSIKSDYKLNKVLQHMGLNDVFDPIHAFFSKISRHPVYVSQFKQKSIIEVNENGTGAIAVDQATLTFTSLPAEFRINRPFAFLIIERTINSILFCGHVKNPILN